jgi:hypothetical protein
MPIRVLTSFEWGVFLSTIPRLKNSLLPYPKHYELQALASVPKRRNYPIDKLTESLPILEALEF